MKRTWEIVITGGPCGGKTKGLSRLKEVFSERGYKVIIVPETATEVITSGIVPGEVSVEVFQELIIKRSLNKEETTRKIAEFFNKDVIIFYDRGLLDNKAYMSYESFLRKLKENSITESQVMAHYDAVFHLVTAADGAEEYYTLENNDARSETPEEARILDKKTRAAWECYQNLRVIDNSTNFEEKINRLINAVFDLLGKPVIPV